MLSLPSVTLWCYATVFHQATAHALKKSLEAAQFAKVIVFTDQPNFFKHVRFSGLRCGTDWEFIDVPHYGQGDLAVQTASRRGVDMVSVWMLTELPKYAPRFTEHALGIQWDGFIVNAPAWKDEWLKYDYVGAAWPDGVVGNNGFWLTSRRLFEEIGKLNVPPIGPACHPYDVRLSYEHCPPSRYYLRLPHGSTGFRGLLEAAGMKWAPKDVADQFSMEEREYAGSFGFHGVKTLASVARLGLFH